MNSAFLHMFPREIYIYVCHQNKKKIRETILLA